MQCLNSGCAGSTVVESMARQAFRVAARRVSGARSAVPTRRRRRSQIGCDFSVEQIDQRWCGDLTAAPPTRASSAWPRSETSPLGGCRAPLSARTSIRLWRRWRCASPPLCPAARSTAGSSTPTAAATESGTCSRTCAARSGWPSRWLGAARRWTTRRPSVSTPQPAHPRFIARTHST
jgi:hypothetical protein